MATRVFSLASRKEFPGGQPPWVSVMVDGVEVIPAPVSSQIKQIPSPKSYANVVGSKPSLAKFDVEVSMVDGKATVAVPDAILDDSIPLWEDFLIGRFPSIAPHSE